MKWYDGETKAKLSDIFPEDDNDDISTGNPEEREGTNSIVYLC